MEDQGPPMVAKRSSTKCKLDAPEYCANSLLNWEYTTHTHINIFILSFLNAGASLQPASSLYHSITPSQSTSVRHNAQPLHGSTQVDFSCPSPNNFGLVSYLSLILVILIHYILRPCWLSSSTCQIVILPFIRVVITTLLYSLVFSFLFRVVITTLLYSLFSFLVQPRCPVF